MRYVFAPSQLDGIHPTLRAKIETNSNLISQKVGRKMYRVLAKVFYLVKLIFHSASFSSNDFQVFAELVEGKIMNSIFESKDFSFKKYS